MKVSYEGTDVLICDTFASGDNPICAVIACTDEAESKLYNWQLQYMNKTGVEIGSNRTVFGLTFYAHCDRSKTMLNDFIKEKEFKIYYGHI
jgi:hypothetical protein